MKNPPTPDLALSAQLTKGSETVHTGEFAGGIAQEMATLPQIRIGRTWFTTAQVLTVLVPVGFVMALVMVATAQQLRTMPEIQAFIHAYPGTGSFSRPVDDGFPWWLRCQHFLNLFLMLFMIRSGLQILADHPRLYLDGDCTPGRDWFRLRGAVPSDRVWTAKNDSVALPGWLGLPGIRHSIGLARWWHFSLDTLWLLNGIIFYVLQFTTDQWLRLVPQSWALIPNAVSTALQYASLDFPPASGWQQYNALQMIAYFTTVFVAAPLAMVTGLLQAPAIAARFKTAKGVLNRQVARTVHFCVLGYFISFVIIHVTMVFSTGLLKNLNHITRGVNDGSPGGLILFGVGIGLIVAAWLVASPFTLKYPRLIQHFGRLLTGWFRSGLESFKPVAQFQGWSGIAKWGGVRMSEILKIVRPKQEARYIVFYSFAHGAGENEGLYYDAHKVEHMRHENTILAYEMNGKSLPELNGAPIRLRNELELGFKQVKWVQGMEFVETFKDHGSGEGGFNEDNEFYGYRAPI